MNYNKILFFSIFLSFLSCENWMYYSNNPWQLNMSSRSSSIGGICLENYNYSNKTSNLNRISMFNSTMFKGLVDYSNIFFAYKINKINILGNSINAIKIGLLNRRITDIPNTESAWNQALFSEPILSDIDYDLIEYYDHKDFSLLVYIPFSNQYGNFGINLGPSHSKINQYKANSFSLDISYSSLNMEVFYFGLLLKNLFSYKKWNTGYVEKFYPSLSALLNYNYSKKVSMFIELKDLYFDSDYLNDNFNFKESVSLGCEYSIYEQFDLRVGFNHDFYTFGIGTKIYNTLFDYTYLDHIDLDSSHQFTISFLIQNK